LLVNMVEGIIGATLLEAPETLGDPRLVDEVVRMVLAVLRAQSAGVEPARPHGALAR
jgi:hypothetical protein